MNNLWPTEITEVSDIIPPVTILDEQALMLGKMTKNVILGEVKARDAKEYSFIYDFYIVAPILGNYRYKLLAIYHDLDFYPITIQPEEGIYKEIDNTSYFHGNVIPSSFISNSEDDFIEILKTIFGSNKAKRVISALLAQSTADSKAS